MRLDPLAAAAAVLGTVLTLQAEHVPEWSAMAVAVVLAVACAWLLQTRFHQLPRMSSLARFALWVSIAGAVCAMHIRVAVLDSPWVGHAADPNSSETPHASAAPVELLATIQVVGLPKIEDDRLRFDARLLSVDSPQANPARWEGRRLRLSWYSAQAPSLLPGERLQAELRLRRPHAQVNPGSFDFERYALQSGLSAVGYVRALRQRLPDAGAASVDRLRWRLAERIDQLAPAGSARFIRALSLGDTRALGEADWALLRKTGLSHLMAISGLHVGLLAALGALLMRGLTTLGGFWRHLPRPLWCALGALSLALPYVFLAGFGLPARRALLMLVVLLLAILGRRRLHPLQGLALAALAVVLLDPLALLGAGFWMSFVGVLWLSLCLPETGESPWRWAGSLLRAQWILGLGLLPLGVLFFAQTSWIGALLNVIAVPVIGFLVVPLALLGTACSSIPVLAGPILALAHWLIDALWALASWSAELPGAASSWPEPSVFSLLLAGLGVLLLLMPWRFPGRWVAPLLLLPLAWPRLETLPAGAVRIQVLDVGQGLAVWIETRQHSLLYDTGPAFRHGGDAGEQTIIPALLAQQKGAPQWLLLSHGDLDHAGGLPSLFDHFGPIPGFSGEPNRLGMRAACAAGMRWRWDGVDFAVLHPPRYFPELGNDSSCVLRVSSGPHGLLIPGDISADVEQRLLNRQPESLASDVLLLAHHGSKHSNQSAFLDAVRPRLAIVSAGADNPFGHPSADLLRQLKRRGIRVLATASSGAISISWAPDHALQWQQARKQAPYFWRTPAVDQ